MQHLPSQINHKKDDYDYYYDYDVLLPNLSKDARVTTSSRSCAVHLRIPVKKEKEIARLIMTALETLSVETITVNSLIHSIMRRMIAE